ncbi:amino acid ABC transporter substrate-binding protein [Deinococcus roseus]|uniref:Branched-chain amino acid ABC transporter substrate-binding protein n=1 Tax=Deinococcus roseus TaxID=392414 RepID=A0ABQ2DE88_9DEIO|nr:amino acid ABC transporter substrate-binding protein [Deinococcus roseus]GGJ51453.1 branched-chain amino acid ABC transporter substrate-binding protein [Deinococcus roseus]
MKKTAMLILLALMSSASAVKVGALIPLSGASSVSGQAEKNGLLLAVDEINKNGGVLGEPLELIIEDDQSNPAKAVPAFTKLVTVDKVDFMVGGLGSSTTLAITGAAKQYNTFMAWAGAASPLVEDAMKDYPYFFHYHPWAYYNFEAILSFFKNLKGNKKAKNIAIAYEDGPFGSSGIQDTVAAFKKAGFNVVLTEAFKAGSGNFAPIINKAKTQKVDIFYWIGYDVDALPLVQQMKESNLDVGLVYGAPPSWPIGFEKNKLSQGVASLTMWTPELPSTASKNFVKAYKAKYGNITDEYFAPLAYLNLKTLAEAINKAGSTNKDKVADVMAKTTFDTPLGKLAFTPSQKIKYQGFKGSNWVTFQFRDEKRLPVFPLKVAKKTVLYPMP